MFELLKHYGVPASFGVVAGFLLVAWIQPTTTGGAALIVFVSVIICSLVATAISSMTKR
jgi:hypothetical protein